MMKIQLRILFISALVFTLAICGCYYDSEEALYLGSGNCDTTSVNYHASIAPIFTGYCNSCHSGSAPNANISTNNYSSVNENIERIKAAINHTGPIPMPPDGSVSACDLAKFNIWYKQGHLDN